MKSLVNFRWPYMTRNKHEAKVEELNARNAALGSCNHSMQAELRILKNTGFNAYLVHGDMHSMTIGVTQSFSPSVIKEVLDDRKKLATAAEKLTQLFMKYIEHYARGGKSDDRI